MNSLESLREEMENAYIEGSPNALQLSQELDKLIYQEQMESASKYD